LWVPEGKAAGRKATPQKCSAPQYVDYVMTWVEDQINKEEVTVMFMYLIIHEQCTKLHCCALCSAEWGPFSAAYQLRLR
jgi:hypothetical protein